MKTIILTDSTSDISNLTAQQLDVIVLPLTVTFGDKSYVDGVDITKKQFFQLQSTEENFPVTSQINPDAFLKIFNECKKNNDEILYISISSKLSGTYQSAVIAKEMAGYDNIYLFDSATASLGEEAFIRIACDMRQAGKGAKEIFAFLTSRIDKANIIALVDTLKYLIKGGRLSKTMGAIGGLLNMKPLISVKDGVIISQGKARGRKNGLEMLISTLKQADIDVSLPIIVTHSDNPDLSEEFISLMRENGLSFVVFTSDIGSVIGTHAGPNCVGISYFIK